jgi:hypothetical protein
VKVARGSAEVKLTAILEYWRIGDGDFPPPSLRVGRVVTVRFTLGASSHFARLSKPTAERCEHQGDAKYRGIGHVRRHGLASSVGRWWEIEAVGLRFGLYQESGPSLALGDCIEFDGLLLVQGAGLQPDRRDTLQIARIRSVALDTIEELAAIDEDPPATTHYIVDFDECPVV